MSSEDQHKEILKRLNEIFCEVFEDDSIKITERSTAADIDEWDSLMHITLVLSVEAAFGVRLNAAEIGQLDDVGALIDILALRAED